MTNGKNRILDRISELIDQADGVKKSGESEEADLWRKRVKTLLERIGGDKLIREYNNCFPCVVFIGKSKEDNQRSFLDEISKIKNLLIAVKEDIEIFGDKETEKETKKIKRHFKAEVVVPLLGKAEWGR